MNVDFTLSKYNQLLTIFQNKGYSFYPLEELPFKKSGKIIVLRHDIDLLPENALKTALLENSKGIKGSYYFRIVPQSNNPEIITQIRDAGHEIGYHYEDLSLSKGNVEIAYDSFCKNLTYFRKYYPVKTICMHGNPKSRRDNRDIWKKYDYREQGIICEPYLDIDFDDIFYLTDTGRRWDGWKVSVRDKMPLQERWTREGLVFHSTNDIIRAVINDSFPSRLMITVHPQRWTNSPLLWFRELVAQSVKNKVKYFMVKGLF